MDIDGYPKFEQDEAFKAQAEPIDFARGILAAYSDVIHYTDLAQKTDDPVERATCLVLAGTQRGFAEDSIKVLVGAQNGKTAACVKDALIEVLRDEVCPIEDLEGRELQAAHYRQTYEQVSDLVIAQEQKI